MKTIDKKKTTTKRTLNLSGIGALLGFTAFIGWFIIHQLVPTWLLIGVIGTGFAPVGVVVSVHFAELVALMPLTVLWVRILKSRATARPTATAISSIILTDMLVGLSLAIAPSGASILALRLILFIAIGALVTPLVVHLFKNIKSEAYAGYAIICLAILLPFAIAVLSFYMKSKFVLGY